MTPHPKDFTDFETFAGDFVAAAIGQIPAMPIYEGYDAYCARLDALCAAASAAEGKAREVWSAWEGAQ